MKKFYVLAFLCLMTISLVSCSKSKSDHVIEGFEKLVEEVENQKGDLTAQEWREMETDFNRRFEELGINEINEEDFSALQKVELAARMVRWTAAMAESAPALMESSFEEAQEAIEQEQN